MMSSRTFIQQRAVLKPTKQTRLGLDEDEETKNGISDNSDIRHLAKFLSTTGPDEYPKPQQRRATRILNRLRKQPLKPEPLVATKPKYIPLPVYRAPSPAVVQQQEPVVSSTLLRDSGIYSEATTSDWVVNDLQFPSPPLVKSNNRQQKKQVRLRHVQVQTDKDGNETDKTACPHCRQAIPAAARVGRPRRPSCPPSLASGKVIASEKSEKSEPEDTKLLFEMLNQLKLQLEQEREHRIQLEKIMSRLMK
ncbi:hypothetical protein K501DRAFT_336325 [Backusella circina FSU 941]|nr:hypothetical protein K501DRAFT_336325 [Backusella circina FSU 941]